MQNQRLNFIAHAHVETSLATGKRKHRISNSSQRKFFSPSNLSDSTGGPPVSYLMSTVEFSSGSKENCSTINSHPNLVMKLRVSGAKLPKPYITSMRPASRSSSQNF
jgi:hypothetical protein